MPSIQPLIRWLRTFQPLPMRVDARERVRVVIGAAFGIGLTALLNRPAHGAFEHAHPQVLPARARYRDADADQRLVGIITQSDLVRALYRAVKG